MTIKIALVGVGKIARDQHIPVLKQHPEFELVATASTQGGIEGVENFKTIDTLLEARSDIDAIALCMPPQSRCKAACAALSRGIHTLLEKPPGATQAELASLKNIAESQNVTLYYSWHSRHARAVSAAKEQLIDTRIQSVNIEWVEDVRKWHPNQEWIWQSGGLGVFDPGINALSIATHILPCDFYLEKSDLVFPENKQAPIAADLLFKCANQAPFKAYFDWRTEGEERWNIEIETDTGKLSLTEGGKRLWLDGKEREIETESAHVDEHLTEYIGVYDLFYKLIIESRSDTDHRPLTQVADAFLLGSHTLSEGFL